VIKKAEVMGLTNGADFFELFAILRMLIFFSNLVCMPDANGKTGLAES
jgi:hypothetical protein